MSTIIERINIILFWDFKCILISGSFERRYYSFTDCEVLSNSTAANVDLVTPIKCSYGIGGSPPSRMALAKAFHSFTQPLSCAPCFLFLLSIFHGLQRDKIIQHRDYPFAEDFDAFLGEGFVAVGKIVHNADGTIGEGEGHRDIVFAVFAVIGQRMCGHADRRLRRRGR